MHWMRQSILQFRSSKAKSPRWIDCKLELWNRPTATQGFHFCYPSRLPILEEANPWGTFDSHISWRTSPSERVSHKDNRLERAGWEGFRLLWRRGTRQWWVWRGVWQFIRRNHQHKNQPIQEKLLRRFRFEFWSFVHIQQWDYEAFPWVWVLPCRHGWAKWPAPTHIEDIKMVQGGWSTNQGSDDHSCHLLQ